MVKKYFRFGHMNIEIQMPKDMNMPSNMTLFETEPCKTDKHYILEFCEDMYQIEQRIREEMSGSRVVLRKNMKILVGQKRECRILYFESIPAFVLTAEDARILCGDINRLYTLRETGVRVLTPLWGGVTCIGGSHTSDEGLTPFGRDVVKECFQTGIIPDVSHASRKSAYEIIDLAITFKKTVIASHSCAFSVNSHTRNLTDEEFLGIAQSGGIVGVNLYPPHLKGHEADVSDVLEHIRHFINLSDVSRVALGCDFDGMNVFAKGGEDVGCIPRLAELLTAAFGKEAAEKILFTNAYELLTEHIR